MVAMALAGWLAGSAGWASEREKPGSTVTDQRQQPLLIYFSISSLHSYGRVQVVVQAREVGRPGLGLEVAQRPLHVLRSTDLLCCY